MAAQQTDTGRQWDLWVRANVASPFRKRALKAAMQALASGATPDQASSAAKEAERNRANYMALSALVLGAISAAVGLFLGGISVLATLFAVASALQGRHSPDRAWQAWTGLGLAALGLVFFALGFVIR